MSNIHKSLGDEIVWRPSEKLRRESRMQAFLDQVELPDRAALCASADADPQWYWDALLKFLNIRFYKPSGQVGATAKGFNWLVGWVVGRPT